MSAGKMRSNASLKGGKTFSRWRPNGATEIVAINDKRVTVSIANVGDGVAWLGNSSDLTPENGYPLYPGTEKQDDDSKDAWYACNGSEGNCDLRVCEVAL